MADPTELDAIEREIVDHLFLLQPTYAVFLGRHEHDGRLPDYSKESTDRWSARARDLLQRLTAIDDRALPPSRSIDRFLLRLSVEGTLFDLEEARKLDQNPMTFLTVTALTPYLSRDYAPVPARVEAIVRVLRGVPALLEQARRRLTGPLPAPFVDIGVVIGKGLPDHFRDAEAFAAAAGLGDAVAAVRAPAVEAIERFLDWLTEVEKPRAGAGFALGPERFQRLLFVREGIEAPFADLRKAGAADLARNQARLQEIARTERIPVSALIVRLQHDHCAASELLGTARGYVEEARRFVESKELVSIPGPVACRVEETPVWGRATTTASMEPPGPFESGTAEGIYYVTLVDPAWTSEQQLEWLRSLHRPMLRNVTVHEVFPGHYLQALHLRASDASLARKVYQSPSFVEGWAHYAEQLVIEAGLGADGVSAEVAQLLDALLRNCRLLASLGLHTEGWPVDRATHLFEKEAYLDPLPAEREAIRGTFDPEYFCYTLGKLAILDVRHRHLATRFGGNRRAFHDALLRLGCPPVGLLDTLLSPVASPAAPPP